jgi:hypothetical protein
MNIRERAQRMLNEEVVGYLAAAVGDPAVPPDESRLTRIAALRDTIESLPPPLGPERLAAIAVAGLSLLIAILTWIWRMPRADFAIDAVTRQVAVRNTVNLLDAAAIRGTAVRFESGAKLWGLHLPIRVEGPREVRGETVWLKNLQVSGSGFTAIKPSADAIDIVVTDGVLQGTVLVRPTAADAYDAADFEIICTAGLPGIVHIVSARLAPITRSGSVAAVDFLLSEQITQENDQQLFRSAIVSGTVMRLLGNRKVLLHSGDVMQLAGVRIHWLEITVDKTIHIVLDGTGEEVGLGWGNTVEDLRPTLLEAALENKAAKLLWGAMIFLSGLLWNVRKYAGGAS